ncbi:MAG: hypothetical protein MUE60_16020 [Candidatus Eisenbacteria bacterium]|nr:hypothetical protein [Candidatus Eisenbacteria bacterium]
MRTTLCAALLLAATCFAYTWAPYGPGEVSVNGWLFHQDPPLYSVLCTASGIQLDQGAGWVPYSYGGLPCEDACALDPQRFLVAMGDSTYSDGIYTFDLTTHQFQIAEWCIHPRFLEHCPELGAYYAGDDTGLKFSLNGLDWASVAALAGQRCFAIAQRGNHLVVAADTTVYCSDDGGASWNPAYPAVLRLRDLAFRQDGRLFGVSSSKWEGSGLWSSGNFGISWEHDFWSLMMSSVAIDLDSSVLCGWFNPGSGGVQDCGVAMWNPDSHELIQLNQGLADSLVNALGSNPLASHPSVLCGTPSGAHVLSGHLSQPHLVMFQVIPTAARLAWSPAGGPAFFDIYRDTLPYPEGTGTPWATVAGTVLTYDVTEGIGDAATDHYYVVRGRDDMQTSARSRPVGDADFAMDIPHR